MTRSSREALEKAIDDSYDEGHVNPDDVIEALAEEGWVVVPREPTKIMIETGNKEIDDRLDATHDSFGYSTMPVLNADYARDVYRAMLAAINGKDKRKKPQPEGRG